MDNSFNMEVPASNNAYLESLGSEFLGWLLFFLLALGLLEQPQSLELGLQVGGGLNALAVLVGQHHLPSLSKEILHDFCSAKFLINVKH